MHTPTTTRAHTNACICIIYTRAHTNACICIIYTRTHKRMHMYYIHTCTSQSKQYANKCTQLLSLFLSPLFFNLYLLNFCTCFAALACKKVPEANSSWQDAFIRRYHNVDINVAVSTDQGLLTPLVRDADRLGLASISSSVCGYFLFSFTACE